MTERFFKEDHSRKLRILLCPDISFLYLLKKDLDNYFLESNPNNEIIKDIR